MSCRIRSLFCLCACLALAACNSGPPSSGKSSSAADEAAVLASRIERLEGLFARRSQAADALDALMSALPDRAWLTEAAYDSGKVRIKGHAASNNLLADYITRLGESPSLSNLTLGGSVMKSAGGREWVEFSLEAVVQSDGEGGSTGSSGLASEARLAELEAALPAGQDSAETLRELQRPALEAGLQLAKLAPAAEVHGEYLSEQAVAIEIQGGRAGVARYLRALAELPRLRIVERFSIKAVSPRDARSDVRASITARTFFSR